MVKHGAISRSHVYQMLGSKDARVRRAAFTLLEVSNPRLRRDGELFMEIIRFIWDANPSYDVYREFSKRHLFVPYKVQELIGARIKIEKREERSAPPITGPKTHAKVKATVSPPYDAVQNARLFSKSHQLEMANHRKS